MEDGFLFVNTSNNNNNTPKQEKNKKAINIFCIVLSITVVFVLIFIGIYFTNKNKEFENYFGGYETAGEYVDSLVTINDISAEPNLFLEDWYSINVSFTNNSEKEIKYIYEKYSVYNAVNDRVKSDFDGREFKRTGPFKTGKKYSSSTEIYYCESSVKYVKFEYFYIEYSDGTTVKFNKAMLNYLNS